jgi:hypothetical protein
MLDFLNLSLATRRKVKPMADPKTVSQAQRRLIDAIQSHGDFADYWPVVNDWVRDSGRAKALALRNITRTVDALIRSGHITIDDDGLFHLTENC